MKSIRSAHVDADALTGPQPHLAWLPDQDPVLVHGAVTVVIEVVAEFLCTRVNRRKAVVAITVVRNVAGGRCRSHDRIVRTAVTVAVRVAIPSGLLKSDPVGPRVG
jgi:hypothetical protein